MKTPLQPNFIFHSPLNPPAREGNETFTPLHVQGGKTRRLNPAAHTVRQATLVLLVVLGLVLSACAPVTPLETPVATQPPIQPTQTPAQADLPAATPTLAQTPAPTEPLETTLFIHPAIPAALRAQAASLPGTRLVDDPAAAQLVLDFDLPADGALLRRFDWIYALVVPFPTLDDGVTLADIQSAWQGQVAAQILLSPETLAVLAQAWGAPVDGVASVQPPDALLNASWQAQSIAAIVPFDALEARWKVIAVDGMKPIDKAFDPAAYPLAAHFYLRDNGLAATERERLQPLVEALLNSNRDPSKMTVLVMTGVTALVRATAYRMELNGNLYPGGDIAATLRDADLTHISNEIAFFEDCPPPEPRSASLFFCSAPKYIELLDDVGTDIVELTGNHMMDYGTEALPQTIAMYAARGWKYYGGGIDLSNSRQPALIEHNGNKLAFIGCNPSGPDFAWATDEHSGAAPCEDYAWLKDEVARLRAEGYLPVVTFQYFENYSTSTSIQMRADFEAVADSGPVIVNGSQAHVPKGFEFYNNAFIHFGLGNLFFDQMEVSVAGNLIPETRYEFMDRHVFYNGKHISVELLTNMLEDYARPRPMNPFERRAFLEQIFAASFW